MSQLGILRTFLYLVPMPLAPGAWKAALAILTQRIVL